MRFPWQRKTGQPRGPYRTAQDRLKEERARIDIKLAQAFSRDLDQHPNFARELARRKFGLEPEPEMPENYPVPEPSSLIDQLRELREIRELVEDSFGSKTSGWQIVADVMKSLPSVLETLKQQPQPGQAYVERPVETRRSVSQSQPKLEEAKPESPLPPPPPQEPEKSFVHNAEVPDEDEQVSQVIAFVENILKMSPEDAVAQLSQGKDDPEDFRSTVWAYITEINDVDSLFEQLPLLESLHDYQKYKPIVEKLQSPAGRQWLSLCLDEVRLINEGKRIETAQNEAEIPGETA